ncbi:MAG: hypothetical protein GYA33_16345 [Thermogutta sp.]|nr:hypothetical protein [Thermogutta sp.]
MRKRRKSLEAESLRVATDLAVAGSPTAERWLNEVTSGERKASLASLIAAEWRTAAPRLAAMIETMTDEDVLGMLHGPIREIIRRRTSKEATR